MTGGAEKGVGSPLELLSDASDPSAVFKHNRAVPGAVR